MKRILVLFAVLGSFASVSFADQTVNEAATATKNDVKRAGKKAANRVKEAVCAEGDVKCAAEKAGNRIEEGADKVSDKAKEAADKVDNNKKSNH